MLSSILDAHPSYRRKVSTMIHGFKQTIIKQSYRKIINKTLSYPMLNLQKFKDY